MRAVTLYVIGLMFLLPGLGYGGDGSKPDASLSVAAYVPPAYRNEGWRKERFELQKFRMSKGNVDLMMIGDSITHGWERKPDHYAVWEKYYGHRNALNFGIGGDQTEDVIWRLQNSPLDKISPKMAVLMIGTNNAGHSKPTAVVDGIKKIIAILKEKYPKIKILVLEIFPRGATPTDPMRISVNAINAELRKELAGLENVELDDLGRYFLSSDGTISKDIMRDYLHLDVEGYLIWAKAQEAKIAEGLGESPAVAQANNANRNQTPWLRETFENEQQALNKGTCELIFIGDSITQRWSLKTPRPPKFEYEHNGWSVWTGPLAKYKPVNLGVDGDRTEHVLWRLEHLDFSKVQPKMAVLHIGVNNTYADDFKATEVALAIRKICQLIHQKCPKAKIVVLNVFPITSLPLRNGNPRQPRVDALNDLIPYFIRDLDYTICKDISKAFRGSERSVPKSIMPDGIHLSNEGYRRWANAIEPELKQVFGNAP